MMIDQRVSLSEMAHVTFDVAARCAPAEWVAKAVNWFAVSDNGTQFRMRRFDR
jgi:hypothetical protein